MAEINGIALMWAICAVDDKVWALQDEIDQGDRDDIAIAELEDDLLNYMKTATDLRISYEQAFKLSNNLTPYEKLVRKYPGRR